MFYAAEIWGWKEAEKLEKLQVKYIKWILGLDFNTLTYIVLEEIKTEKIRIEAGRSSKIQRMNENNEDKQDYTRMLERN